ncbi:MAG: site-2 protease family protein, partial [Planctomycetota bacterium]
MFGKSIKLFRLFGFRVSADLSFLIIVGLVIWSLYALFSQWYPELGAGWWLLMGFGGAVGLFISITVHEFSHSLVARRFGLPMRGITLFVFGGVAEMTEEPPSPKAEIVMALAGPAASVLVAVVFWLIWWGGLQAGWSEATVAVFRWIATINTALVVFNMIPGFPLDGGRVLRGILWSVKHDFRSATHWASRMGVG